MWLTLYKITGWSTSTTRVEPGVTEVPLAGEPISIVCEKHAVVKAASNATTVNFMIVVYGECCHVGGQLTFYTEYSR